MKKMIRLSDCETVLARRLKRPAIADPAVYLPQGEAHISAIPYQMIDTGDLDMVTPETFRVPHKLSQVNVVTERQEICPFYIINEQIQQPDRPANSHLRHLQFGYGKIPLPHLPALPFSETIGKADADRLTWWKECVQAALAINRRYADLAVCLSGGVDSELTACAFLDARVPFTTVIMRYLDTKGDIINTDDFSRAMQFCNMHSLKPMIFDVKIVDDIIDGRHNEYYLQSVPETHSLLPTLYTQTYMIELCNKLGMVPIMGSDQIELKTNKDGKVCIGETSFSLGLAAPTWAHYKGLDVVYDFFMYTPNQIVSYLDIVVKEDPINISYTFKNRISYLYGSKRLQKLLPRPKSTGYEKVVTAMEDVGYSLHALTMANIDAVDWSERASTQYIHDVRQVVRDGLYNDWQVIRTTTNDFFCRGFDQHDARYYDL